MGIKPRRGKRRRSATHRCDEEQSTHLTFALKVVDGWPPVAAEGIPCVKSGDGYKLLAPPLFLKGLSVDDIIEPNIDHVSGQVFTWKLTKPSSNSTIWLLRLQKSKQIQGVLGQLRKLGCFIAEADQLGCYAVNVPAIVAMEQVDQCLRWLDEHLVAVAFPSFRQQ
jgi:hypothetical protein